jgi:hypothetical protein
MNPPGTMNMVLTPGDGDATAAVASMTVDGVVDRGMLYTYRYTGTQVHMAASDSSQWRVCFGRCTQCLSTRHYIQKCQQWHTDRNAFWRSYKPKGATCPFPASKLAEHFKIKMSSWDQTATSPAPTDPQHNIDVTSTSAGLGEIVAAL